METKGTKKTGNKNIQTEITLNKTNTEHHNQIGLSKAVHFINYAFSDT